WDEALKYGEMLRATDPNNPWGPYAVGAALNAKGQSQQAADLLIAVATAGPSRPEFAKAYADTLVALERPAEAEKFYRKAIELDPTYGDALVALGLLLLTEHKEGAARDSLVKARAVDPDNPRARLAVASLYAFSGKAHDAIKELEAIPPR